jgi:hypothetical protein
MLQILVGRDGCLSGFDYPNARIKEAYTTIYILLLLNLKITINHGIENDFKSRF